MNQNPLPPLPLPPLPPLVLQPLPVPNPAVNPPNWVALSAAFQTVANETAQIPNGNYAQQILTMNANMVQVVQTFNTLQAQLVGSHNALVASHNAVAANHNAVAANLTAAIARLDLVPMRGYNGAAAATATLQYPPGVAPDPTLPVTVGDALNMTGPQYIAAINHLVAQNSPGLVVFAGANNLVAKRQHLLHYLGIYI